MKNYLLIIILCGSILFSAFFQPVFAAENTTQWFPWAESILQETRSADFIYKLKSVFGTRNPRPTFQEIYRKLQKQTSISPQAELFLQRAKALHSAANKNPVLKDYVFTVQFAADIGPAMPQQDFEFLSHFLSSSYKVGEFDTQYLPQKARHYQNGTIFLQLPSSRTQKNTPMYLIIEPEYKTIQFAYADASFKHTALQGRFCRLW